MMKIAFLASKVTLPGSPTRREDAHEHDLQVAELSGPLRQQGFELVAVDWMDERVNWSGFAAAIIGTTWDYWDHQARFLETLKSIEAGGTPLFNPSALVEWNSRKTYLRELSEMGVRTIPTLWPSHPTAQEIEAAFETLQTDGLVVKRQVGAGACDQHRYRKGDVIQNYPFDAMIQPFLPTIQTEGEFSFIMIDGEMSHALVKRARAGDYRIQSLYGGVEEAISPTQKDIEAVKQVLTALDEVPLYARVDMIRDESGELCLMELEMIEPYLYPEQSTRLGVMVSHALARRLA